jgi:hypothetical protein
MPLIDRMSREKTKMNCERANDENVKNDFLLNVRRTRRRKENVSLINETKGFENETKRRDGKEEEEEGEEEEKRSFVSHFIVLWLNLIDQWKSAMASRLNDKTKLSIDRSIENGRGERGESQMTRTYFGTR